MISFHPDKTRYRDHWRYSEGFHKVDTDDPQKIAKLMNFYVTSPIVWKYGQRAKKNFIECNWIALDFDGGISLEEVLDEFQDFTHVIGTTENHQKPKKNEAAQDRMRVYLRLKETITSCDDYEACVRYYVDKYKSDWQAIDGARKFKPCPKIISAVEGLLTTIKKKSKRQYEPPKDGQKGVPRWALQLLSHGVGFGASRNTACFKLGICLTRAGFSIPEIISMIMNSPIPLGPHVIDEVERAVKSGANRA